MDQILTLVGQYAFPIVMCLVMAWYVKDQSDAHRDEVAELNKLHQDETGKLADAINNNTVVLQKLIAIMEVITNGEK